MSLQHGTRVVRLFALVLVATTLPVAPTFAQSPTFVRTDYSSLGNNHVVGDFNGDGKPDLAGQGAMSTAILLGNGDGTFQARVEYPVASWNQDLAAGDFNGDGSLDLVVTINDPLISLSLLTGNGNGTFNAAVNFPNTSHLDSPAVVATDLDNDGKLDVVIGHDIACWTAPCIVGRTITVMRGNGDGTFQPAREIDIGTTTAKIAVGDFNRDGFKDLGIASHSSRVCILLGVGDGTFNQTTLTLIPELNIGMDNTDIDVADLNGDTIEDLVVALSLNGSRTAILIGNGDGTFRQPLLITEPEIRVPQYQAVADYNGDGFQDLALALAWGSNGLMELLNGNGDGTFQPLVLYLVPPPLSSIGGISISAADFNSDGKPDIALGWGGASVGLAVLRNTTGNAPAPTLNSVTVSPPSVVGGNASTGTVSLASTAPSGGAVVSLSDNSAAASTPATVTVPAGSTGANFTVTTTTVTSSTSVTISAVYAGVTRTAALMVNPPPTPAAPSLVSPANAATVAQPVTLDWNNVPNATSYEVQVDNSSTIAAPFIANPTVTVSQAILSGLPAQQLWWRVRARNAAGVFGPFSSTRRFTPQGTATPPSLSAVAVNPTSVVGGNSSMGTVTLSAAAPSGGVVVTLSSSSTAVATLPASATVAAGATSAPFTVSTSAVSVSTPVTISAVNNGVTRTATLTVSPPGQMATLTVTATGRSGERVTSSPAGINVAVGSTGSASFNAGTSITVSVTNGRDAIWSGACSSSGNKTRTCTFTLNANASVGASVQ